MVATLDESLVNNIQKLTSREGKMQKMIFPHEGKMKMKEIDEIEEKYNKFLKKPTPKLKEEIEKSKTDIENQVKQMDILGKINSDETFYGLVPKEKGESAVLTHEGLITNLPLMRLNKAFKININDYTNFKTSDAEKVVKGGIQNIDNLMMDDDRLDKYDSRLYKREKFMFRDIIVNEKVKGITGGIRDDIIDHKEDKFKYRNYPHLMLWEAIKAEPIGIVNDPSVYCNDNDTDRYGYYYLFKRLNELEKKGIGDKAFKNDVLEARKCLLKKAKKRSNEKEVFKELINGAKKESQEVLTEELSAILK